MSEHPPVVIQTKYETALEYHWTRAYRAAIRTTIRGLASWRAEPLDENGYTLILGCNTELAEMLPGNLGCLARQHVRHLREVLLVFERLPGPELQGLLDRFRAQFPGLPCRVLAYSPLQRLVLGAIGWVWINCWLSWCLGIAACRTRWAMLHDFDAMLVDPDFLEKRFAAIREQDLQYLGITNYHNPSNGLLRDDGFAATIEMMFDARFVRSRFRPIDIFNHVSTFRGRRVDFDTFLWVQHCAGRAQVIPVDLDDVVHPSQMICHYVFLRQGNRRLPLDVNSLMLIPYFISVGGDLRPLQEMTEQMAGRAGGSVRLYGRRLDLRPLTQAHLEWIIKQAKHLDRGLFQQVRPDVVRYCDVLRRFVESARPAPAGDAPAAS